MHRLRFSIAPLCAAVLLLVVPAGAAATTRAVCPSSCTYATPQAAVDAAGAGDTVTIAAGSYGGIVLPAGFSADGVTIEGASAATTTLTGGLAATNDAAHPLAGLTVRDLTITGPSTADGSSVVSTFLSDGGVSDLTLRRVVLDGGGGDVRLLNGRNLRGTLTVVDSELRNSTDPCIVATQCAAGGANDFPDAVVLSGDHIHDVSGAVVLRGADAATPLPSVTVTDTRFDDIGPLSAADGAEGALVVRGAATLLLTGDTLTNVSGGPALSLRGIADADIHGNRVSVAPAGLVVEPADGQYPGPETWTGSVARNDFDVSGAALSLPADFDPAAVTVSGNSLRGTLAYAGTGTLDAQHNWWGCNAGPGGSGCSSATGDVDTTPYLRLTLTADPSSQAAGWPVTLRATMVDSDSGAVQPVADRTVAFSANSGSVSPTAATVGTSAATATLTPPSPTPASILATATLDAATPQVSIPFTPILVRSAEGEAPPEPVEPMSGDELRRILFDKLGLQELEADLARRRMAEAEQRVARSAEASHGPIAGTCLLSVTSLRAQRSLMGQMTNCGAPPADPHDAIDTTNVLRRKLSREVERLRALGATTAALADAAAGVAAQASTSKLGPPLVEQAQQLGAFAAMLIGDIDQALGRLQGQADRFDAMLDTIADAIEGRRVSRRPRLAHAAAAHLTRAQAWDRLVALQARLRAIVNAPAPSRASSRLRAQRRTPVMVLACQTAPCRVALRSRLTIRHDRVRLPTQRLRVAGGAGSVVRVALGREHLRALRRHGRGTLVMAVVSRGHVRTVRARLFV